MLLQTKTNVHNFGTIIKYLIECNSIKTIKSCKASEYEKDWKIKFNSDDNFSLNKLLKLHDLKIVIKSILKRATNIIYKIFTWMVVWIINVRIW